MNKKIEDITIDDLNAVSFMKYSLVLFECLKNMIGNNHIPYYTKMKQISFGEHCYLVYKAGQFSKKDLKL